METFGNLRTEQFRLKMKPHAIKIYESLFCGCELEDLREKGVKVHILDKEFGIDSLINLKSGQYITIQEKYRENIYLTDDKYHVDAACPDFTQEYKNAAGTIHESDGEWFSLAAQLYFYGWANKKETGFEMWVLLDIPKYKIIVENAGGLDKIGKIQYNKREGRASFYAIPINRLKPAWIANHAQGFCDK